MSDDPYGDRTGEPGERWGEAPPPDGPPPDAPPPVPPRGELGGTSAWGNEAMPVGAQPATVGKRVGAYIIDSILLALAFAIVGLVVGLGAGLVPTTPEAVTAGQTYTWSIISTALTLAYFVLLEAASGQTLAKRMLRIKVIMADGSPVTLEAAFKRRVLFVIGNLIPVIGGLISFAVPLAALVTAIQDEPANMGFHDRWAGTRVIEA